MMRALKGIHGGHHVTAADTEGTSVVLAGDVEGDDGIQPFDGAIIEHSGGAADAIGIGTLFAGLEEEADFAGRRRIALGEEGGDAEQHGGVGVVAAGMHLAGDFRGIGDIVDLLEGEGIHIGADADATATAGGAAFDAGDDAGTADARLRLEAERAEVLGDEGGSLRLFEAELWVLVNGAAPFDDLWL